MRVHTKTTRLALGASTIALLVLTGCGGSNDTNSGAATPTQSKTTTSQESTSPGDTGKSTSKSPSQTKDTGGSSQEVAISIKDYVYSGPDSVSAGATVTVTNEDDVAHTVTSDDGSSFDVNVPAGETATFTAPDKAGDFAYHCTYHGNMTATLTVS